MSKKMDIIFMQQFNTSSELVAVKTKKFRNYHQNYFRGERELIHFFHLQRKKYSILSEKIRKIRKNPKKIRKLEFRNSFTFFMQKIIVFMQIF